MRHLRLGLTGLALALCPALVGSQPVASPKPALWKLADDDTTIFLFGTYHALPKTLKWRTSKVEAAIAASQELVLESVESKEDLAKLEALMAPKEGLKPVLDRVAPEYRDRLEARLIATGAPLALFDKFPTWVVAFYVDMLEGEKQGIEAQYGADTVLEDHFTATGRPKSGVEDGVALMTRLDAMAEVDQVYMLEQMIVDPAQQADAGDVMLTAWSQGNVQAIADEVTERTLGRVGYDIIVRQRNHAWTGWLTNRMDKPGTIFFAVGAGHFAGPDSVLALLDSQGLTVERVQ